MAKKKETGIYDMGPRMPSKGMHKMPGGMMMSDAEMQAMMKKRRGNMQPPGNMPPPSNRKPTNSNPPPKKRKPKN